MGMPASPRHGRRVACAAVFLALTAAACGTTIGGTQDACNAPFESDTTMCIAGADKTAYVRIDKVEGDVPPLMRAGTFGCSISAPAGRSFYPDLSGTYPSSCITDWKLELKVHDGETGTVLTPQPRGSVVAAVPAGQAVMVLSLPKPGDTSCNLTGASYSPTGVGTIQLERLPSTTKASCVNVRFIGVELRSWSGAAPTFRVSGAMRLRGLPVGT
jgi:hypothetical protein